MPYFPTQPQPKQRHTSGKTRTRWSNWRHRFNPIKTEHYNMQDQETNDFRKLDIIEPTPNKYVQGCMGSTYCKYDTPHPSMTPSDWSSEDWDGEKVKAREQCPLLDFNQLEKQLKQTLQDPIQDISQNTLDDHMVEKSLSKDLQALTLNEDVDNQNLVDTQETRPEVLEDNNKVKRRNVKHQY